MNVTTTVEEICQVTDRI